MGCVNKFEDTENCPKCGNPLPEANYFEDVGEEKCCDCGWFISTGGECNWEGILEDRKKKQ